MIDTYMVSKLSCSELRGIQRQGFAQLYSACLAQFEGLSNQQNCLTLVALESCFEIPNHHLGYIS